jgi:transcription elongation factor GreA
MVITRAGFAQAVEQLEQLKTVGRREVAGRIRLALAAETNPAESAEYHDARDEQARLEQKIVKLERRLAHAEILEPDAGNGVADVGERVRLRDLETDEMAEYDLVGSLESDPESGRISVTSPVGRALLGRRAGEITVAHAPGGPRRFEILTIATPRWEGASG